MIDIDYYQLLVYQLTTSGVSRDWVGMYCVEVQYGTTLINCNEGA